MNRRKESLIEHREGNGRLMAAGNAPLPVRYILDTWLEQVPTGSGRIAGMQRMDGFVWWQGTCSQRPDGTLVTEDGQKFGVSLYDVRSNRAGLYCRTLIDG